MKQIKNTLALLLICTVSFSVYSQKQPKRNLKMQSPNLEMLQYVEPSCDTIEYPERTIVGDDALFIFMSVQCFPKPADENTYFVGWDPLSKRLVNMPKNWALPSQSGNSNKILSTNGDEAEWVDIKKSIPLIGVTDANGDYTYTYPVAYSTVPCVTATLVSGDDLDRWRITSSTTTGFTVHAFRQNTNTLSGIINLVSGTTNLNGATINVLVTEQ